MWTRPLLVVLLQSALVCIAAIVAPRAKLAALLLGALAFFGTPWLAGENVLLRGLCALLGFVSFLRVVDTVRFGGRFRTWRRVLHVASVVDSRTLRRAPPTLDVRALGRSLLWAAVAASGFYVAGSSRPLVRWAGGLVLTYAIIESGWGFVGAAYRAVGFVTPPLHVWPAASLSMGELWGVRWARPVSTWLRENCFRPLARRGLPSLGLLLGFVVSAVGHAFPVLVALGPSRAAMMFAFFAMQGLLVIVETKVGVSRWTRPARRAWTVTLMVMSSPLFVEPALSTLGYLT